MSVNFEEISREFNVEFGESVQSSGGSVKITDARHLFFYGARLDSMEALLRGCEKVTSMAGMFQGCSGIASLDLSGLDTSEATSMESAFESCTALTEVNTEGWNTSKVTNTSRMFYACAKLVAVNVADWDVSNVTYMNHMFNGCSSLKRVDMSKWDTSKVKNMQGIFLGCSSLEEIIGFSATAGEDIRIGFPSGDRDGRFALKRLTFRTDIDNSICSDIDVSYCSFERDGFVEMFNSLPDVSDYGIKHITITGNPCVGRSFESVSGIEEYVWNYDLFDTPFIFELYGKRYTMDGNDMLSFMSRYTEDEELDFKMLVADTELLTDEDKKIAIRKGWSFVEV